MELLSKEAPVPKSQLNRVKRDMWNGAMTGVATKYNSEHITGETEVRNDYSVVSNIKLSAYAFENDFSRNIYMNANKTKIKFSFRGSYISKILPVSSIEFILDKK
jgi:hypothetical protein